MQTLISFLRGVNMAGHNSIKMNALAALYEKNGFIDAETYIQSGNVIFRDKSGKDPDAISEKIEKAIMKEFGLDIDVMTRTPEDLEKIISRNPFSSEKNFDPARLACIFVHDLPLKAQIEQVKDVNYPPDKFKIIGREIFIYCPNGFGKTKLYTNFFENKMKIRGTARNWNTINTVLATALKK